jgi:hypothetical protein
VETGTGLRRVKRSCFCCAKIISTFLSVNIFKEKNIHISPKNLLV